ncbi:MAG: SDR family NAD(P)-dependent oxidoreductase [Cellvibrionaceae bacterium]
MTQRLNNKRILITQASDYMGPDIAELFRQHGGEVIEDHSDLTQHGACEKAIEAAGEIDVLVINLAASAHFGIAATEVSDDIWSEMFDLMVHPLHRLTRAALPQMIERKAGKILVIGSATGIKGMAGVSAYSAARAAQVGYIRSAALEVAANNIQINLIAQNWVENPAYFNPEFTNSDEFKQLMANEVPIQRLATGREDALFALFLASNESDFFVGQAIPFSGGWAQS